jgi:hypothetical protein
MVALTTGDTVKLAITIFKLCLAVLSMVFALLNTSECDDVPLYTLIWTLIGLYLVDVVVTLIFLCLILKVGRKGVLWWIDKFFTSTMFIL